MRRETLVRPEHLERLAMIYVRQSTPAQVRENRESTRLQYGLRDRAEELGWPRDRIRTVDEDLGKSGSGDGERPGFSRLLLEVARGKVGAVFGLDASRFSRNGVEWFELLRWLRATGTLLVTDEGVYDARSGDDSFVLGIHGTLSEAELHRIRARMEKGKLAKAKRGELYVAAPTGFVVDGKRLRKDPDEHVREAIGLVFAKFRELGTARRVAQDLRNGGVRLPTRFPGSKGLEWRKARYSRVWNVLRNPAMGGAYTWGRTRTRWSLDGKDRAQRSQRKVPMDEWQVLIPNHHEGYVEWEEWQAIQQRLAANCVAQGGNAPREGRALLQGLATCGHCGKTLQVRYSRAVQYRCQPNQDDEGGCQFLGGERLDRLVAKALLEAVGPAMVKAALEAERLREEEEDRKLLGFRREVERREWEEGKARREYLEIEPEFRRVKRTLAREWERAQEELERARQDLERERQGLPSRPVRFRGGDLDGLGRRLEAVWEAETTTWRDRKKLLATVMEEVVLTTNREEGKLHVLLRWRGGWIDGRDLPLCPRPKVPRLDERIVTRMRRLAEFHTDAEVAGELNRQGLRTVRGKEFTGPRVTALRARFGIPARGRRPDGEDDPADLVAVPEAARELGTSVGSLYRWIREGIVPAERAGPGCPLRVRLDDTVRSRFRDTVPQGYVSLAAAQRELGVSRQTLWVRIREGSLQPLRVTRGPERGVYVRLEPSKQPPLPVWDDAGGKE